jgi:hypothetical protein
LASVFLSKGKKIMELSYMRRIFILAIFAICLFASQHRVWAAAFDNTTCFVLNDEDSEEYYNSLRRKIEDGWNRRETRLCTQAIHVKVPKITLESPLDINNENAMDCRAGSDKPKVCGDSWALVIDGAGSRATIDVSSLPGDTCAISLHANHVKINNIDIIATPEQVQADKVICDSGENNDTSDVTINGNHHPAPSPTPTPSPTPKPTPSPTPKPTPTPSPTPKPTPSPTPKPTPTPSPTPTASPVPTPSATPQPTPSASPEASNTPNPLPSSTPAVSPNPSGSGGNGAVSSFGGCDGGTKSGCTITAADSPRAYVNYLVGIMALLGFSLFKRIRHKG